VAGGGGVAAEVGEALLETELGVTGSELGNLGATVVLEVLVDGQGDRVAVVVGLRATVDGRGLGEGQDGNGQGNQGGDLHGENRVVVGWVVEGEEE